MSQTDNLARQTIATIPLVTPQAVPKPETSPIHKADPVKRTIGVTRLEKIVIGLFSIVVFGLSYLSISAGVNVNRMNQNQQDMVQQTKEIQVINTNLGQQIQELSRYDRIYTIAQQFGLTENEENVRNVSK